MNVKDLKIYLREVLLRLECYEDEQNVELSCNTYGMSGDLLEIRGKGFIDLGNLDNCVEELEESDDE